ncbi:MAG: 3-dehydroquinate synthase [Propionibacteriaceae bacterium]|nr:3-dehydroquinate synthase [Propionibacteriaceae bacterium]
MTIVFIGLPASGKTTIGAEVAEKLGLTFVDADAMIEQRARQSIREIFADKGEPYFRELELDAVTTALATTDVVSVGGGAITNPAIRELLGSHQVVWLDAPISQLMSRVQENSDRPLLSGDTHARFIMLEEERLSLYAEAAHFTVDAGRDKDEVVTEVLKLIAGIQIISVDAGHPYQVVIGSGVLNRLAGALEAVDKVAILHPPVLSSMAADLAQELPNPVILEVPEGESAKTAEVLDHCWRTLAQSRLTRSDAVIGLGGGSTTDLAGFVAATYLRGIRFINISTTVLGMADAAVGGKTGINIPEGKNLVGSFYEPHVVLCDLDLLKGLPTEEVRSGLAEVVKCGFISDLAIVEVVTQDPSKVCDTTTKEFAEVLTRAIQVKARVVSGDLREQDQTHGAGRAALNYGHTLGHAIEKREGFTWSHGNAISVGMVYAAEVALRLGMIDADIVTQHREILGSLGLPISYSGSDWKSIRSTMSLDKKARGSQLRLILLDGLGDVRVVPNIDENILEQAFLAIRS